MRLHRSRNEHAASINTVYVIFFFQLNLGVGWGRQIRLRTYIVGTHIITSCAQAVFTHTYISDTDQ